MATGGCHTGIILQIAYVYVNYKILYIFLSLMLFCISYDFFGQNSCLYVKKYMHKVQTDLILTAFFCITQ
jgi:hypothetical protein